MGYTLDVVESAALAAKKAAIAANAAPERDVPLPRPTHVANDRSAEARDRAFNTSLLSKPHPVRGRRPGLTRRKEPLVPIFASKRAEF
jgi:hypothetical protein